MLRFDGVSKPRSRSRGAMVMMHKSSAAASAWRLIGGSSCRAHETRRRFARAGRGAGARESEKAKSEFAARLRAAFAEAPDGDAEFFGLVGKIDLGSFVKIVVIEVRRF
jgi:hypothetical protein